MEVNLTLNIVQILLIIQVKQRKKYLWKKQPNKTSFPDLQASQLRRVVAFLLPELFSRLMVSLLRIMFAMVTWLLGVNLNSPLNSDL